VGGVEVTPSGEALALIESLEAEAGSLCDPIGCADEMILRASDSESPAGNLVADALFSVFSDVDVAIQNSGGLRASIPAGTIRREQLHALMPFENRLLLVELTGAQLSLFFRIGTSGAHGIPQVSGARYRYDPAGTAGDDLDGDGEVAEWERNRLCGVWVGGRAIDANAIYRVALPDFLVEGGDHFGPVFAEAPVVDEGPLVREVIYRIFDNRSACLGSGEPLVDPEAPRIELGPCTAR